ncbi:MAG: EAL and GGDEF domain-containing protein [Thermodesulfovibrionales bacterium]|nr:EAL and GGDEF domain-containing protein [Thermodesulfovibrionales bacterium]
MAVRLKWELEFKRGVKETYIEPCVDKSGNGKDIKTQLLDLIDLEGLTSHFQPIYSLKHKSIYGFEALARIKEPQNFPSIKNIIDLFSKARQCGILSLMDVTCCFNAIKTFSEQQTNDEDYLLFINLSPETICDKAFGAEISEDIIKNTAISKENIVFEITEESMAHNLELFKHNIQRLKGFGFKIAIDDFGAGFGGLKMLSIVEPDFVKIDRHFISNLDKAIVKYNIVDSITITCNRMGIRVIAEGVERKEEFDTLSSMNIDFFQGYFICKPQPYLKDISINDAVTSRQETQLNNIQRISADAKCIGDIAQRLEGLSSDTPVKTIVNLLIDNPDIRCQPIVDEDMIKGMVFRNRFIENQIVGKYGYGLHLNYHKKIKQVMEKHFTIVEYNETLEDVSNKVQKRDHQYLYDEIAVTKNGKYYGVVSISNLLDAITQKSLVLAKSANPLTGLPGNEAIQREIEKRITQNMHFDVAYFDLNNFKPFNDYYGFAMGDYVIKSLAEILTNAVDGYETDDIFVGHIGGDDFIMVSHPSNSIKICKQVIAMFEQQQVKYHGAEDYKAGCYTTKNRKGEIETFKLLSLSIAIVSTEVYKIDSYAQLASIASEVKKAAKQQSNLFGRSSLVRDRRLMG